MTDLWLIHPRVVHTTVSLCFFLSYKLESAFWGRTGSHIEVCLRNVGGVPIYRESLHLSTWLKSWTTVADNRGKKLMIKRAKTNIFTVKDISSVSPTVASAK